MSSMSKAIASVHKEIGVEKRGRGKEPRKMKIKVVIFLFDGSNHLLKSPLSHLKKKSQK